MSSPTISRVEAGTETYPLLTDEQLARMQHFAMRRAVAKGEILYRPGDIGVPFYVLLSATIEIVQLDGDGERPVAQLYPGMFTGEAGMFGGHRAIVLARIFEAGEVLEITPDNLRFLVSGDTEISDVLIRAFIRRRLMLVTRELGNVLILGSPNSPDVIRLREFLGRVGHPYMYFDLDRDIGGAGKSLLDRFGVSITETPLVICNGKTVMRNPTLIQLADFLGLNDDSQKSLIHDLVIVGAGPAGLAAGVYAASEGLDVLLVDRHAPGGQAGASSKIENYLGFPTGISGQELAANAVAQARRFGAKLAIAQGIVGFRGQSQPYELVTDDGRVFCAKSVVIATGARYKKPDVGRLSDFEGRGVYYSATNIEAQLCKGDNVVVVGGGNSAGQAAVFLSQVARKVYMLVRSADLSQTMSHYLTRRIEANPSITLLCNTELVALSGDSSLEEACWHNRSIDQTTSHRIKHVFVMAGASPNTEWLQGCIALDRKGFILTGLDLSLSPHPEIMPSWSLRRSPYHFECSLPGVFAIGDARAGSIKRVASAAGEGAISVSLVHQALAEFSKLRRDEGPPPPSEVPWSSIYNSLDQMPALG